MQRPDEAKRHTIMDAAANLFASRPFHEVRLDDVAEAAGVGKGTLYVYFKGKDDLYATLVYEALSQLIERMTDRIETVGEQESAWTAFEAIVRELVLWATQFPDFFKLMRSDDMGGLSPKLRAKRTRLGELIESVLRRGVRAGEFDDPNPALTAQFVPACVRTSLRHGPSGLRQDEIVNHVLRVLGRGIRKADG